MIWKGLLGVDLRIFTNRMRRLCWIVLALLVSRVQNIANNIETSLHMQIARREPLSRK